MKLELLPEPDLEFGAGPHVDMRFGIRDFGPIGFDNDAVSKVIRIGFVGTPNTIGGIRQWMESARAGIEAKPSKKPKFRPAFPGFGLESPFRCDWASEDRLERAVSRRELDKILAVKDHNKAVDNTVDAFFEECRYLDKMANVDVVICAPPIELLRHLDAEEDAEEDARRKRRWSPKRKRARDSEDERDIDFHDLLKARSLTLGSPVQFVRPHTYDETVKQFTGAGRVKGLQDAATRAWNFHTALYYKAGGTPWRLLRRTSELESCYVGISFYKTIDRQHIHTSSAQVFNERGDGMILRGGEAKMSKDDLQPHLTREDMKKLVEISLAAFDDEHHHLPARVVIHKTSGFTDAELRGCEEALEQTKIRHRDIVVVRESDMRLFRTAAYPPLRGTFLELEERSSLLYSRGSIPFFEMYAGMYVPRALEIEAVAVDESQRVIGQEILALTKMNWNNTQFDSALPITIRAARQVGDILKYAIDLPDIHTRYAFYM
jgi:hypothetical protein